MPLHKRMLQSGFPLPVCEKHFHDHDETWAILKGRGTGYWIDPWGKREEFVLEEGDIWMIPAGYEHGTEGFKETGKNSDDFKICAFNGTLPPGSHKPGHHYVEKEGYLPSLELRKTPTDRYTKPPTLPARMRGLVFPEKGKSAFQEEPVPGCNPGHVLCRTLFTGLTNGTERNVMMGGNYGGTWPARCGYQNVGRVLAVGPGVADIQAGDLVFSGDFCQHAEFFMAPVGAEKLWVKLPDTVAPQHAALFGVASVALHDVRRADVKLGERVLVVGAGPVGQLTAQAARLTGAVVTVCDLDARRLEMARALGAHATIPLTTEAASWGAVRTAGPFDVVLEDSGAPILDRVIGANWGQGVLKSRSRVAMIAGRDRVDYSFNAGQSYELSVLHAGHFVRDDLLQVCRLTAEGALKMEPLIAETVKASDAIGIYARLRDDPASLLGVVFDWE